MRIVRLSNDLVAEWRENLQHPVDDDGTVHQPFPRELETAAAGLAKQAKTKRRTCEQSVVVAGRRHQIVAKVDRVGNGADDFLLELRIDGRRVISAREIICARMLEEHGECQLRHSNGVILKVVRDPAIERTTFKQSLQVAPRPEHCPCAAWGQAHPGHHHHTCQWNKLAPPEERAPEPENAGQPRRLSSLATRASTTIVERQNQPVVAKLNRSTVVTESLEGKAERNPPDKCENSCRDHALPKGTVLEDGQHHPMCPYYDYWKRKTSKDEARWVVDLDTGEKVRHATDEEIGRADIEQKKMGQPIIQIDSRPFGVLSESELAGEEKSA